MDFKNLIQKTQDSLDDGYSDKETIIGGARAQYR